MLDADELYNQGSIVHKSGKITDAYNFYLSAIRADHNQAESWNNLAAILRDEKKLVPALACARRACGLKPNNAVFRMNLGDLLLQSKLYDEAKEHLIFVTETDPSILLAWQHLAFLYMTEGRYNDGNRMAERALSLDPGNGNLRWTHAFGLLASGDYEQGFRAWECRLGHSDIIVPTPDCPLWQGQSLAGKTLYVYGEQGFGDIIQFARYLKFLPKDIGEIILETPAELRRLLEANFNTIGPVRFRNLFEDPSRVIADYHVSLLSIPGYLQLGHIPNKSYLVPASSTFSLHRPHGIKRAIGICWSGHSRHLYDDERSSTLEDFFKALARPGIELYALQIPQADQKLDPALLGPMGLVQDLGFHFNDFADTAAAIDQLDAVVCVDTAVAHLTGALGKPCHLVLPHRRGLDWRWGRDSSTSCWYPSMKLYRQGAGDSNYSRVLDLVADDIGLL